MEREKHQLDRMDRKILDILQREGRIAITELATRVGLSTSPCAERVKRMERDGVITGYHAQVAATAVDKPLLVFVEIKLSAKGGDVFDAVRDELLHMPEVMECHLVSGDFDYLLKFRLRDMREYRSLLGGVLKRLPVAAESRSLIVMEEIKESLYLPLAR
jgi:Lrp/AsnC family leucine-responsive transcriptional regulator